MMTFAHAVRLATQTQMDMGSIAQSALQQHPLAPTLTTGLWVCTRQHALRWEGILQSAMEVTTDPKTGQPMASTLWRCAACVVVAQAALEAALEFQHLVCLRVLSSLPILCSVLIGTRGGTAGGSAGGSGAISDGGMSAGKITSGSTPMIIAESPSPPAELTDCVEHVRVSDMNIIFHSCIVPNCLVETL